MLRRFFLSLFTFLSQVAIACPTHESNQKIFSEIIETYLAKDKSVSSFFCGIDAIGQEALEKGLDLSCYTYDIDPKTQGLFYKSYTLWEGQERTNMIFLLLVWPAQQEALQCCPNNEGYKTTIHSHPISCAYTVMQNEITEHRYALLDCGGCVKFREKEIFYPGDKVVDLNQSEDLFIHQLLFEGNSKQPAITLHVYGSSTVEEFRRIYKENGQHEYHLKKLF